MRHGPSHGRTTKLWAGLATSAFLAVGSVQAADLTVTSGADSGTGTLREALAQAKKGDRIVFAPELSTITLTTAELVVDQSVTIAGPGPSRLTVTRDPSAPARFRIFNVSTSVMATLSGLTISGGRVDHPERGAGILSAPDTNLTVKDCVITDNQTSGGGGGIAAAGTLVVVSTTIAGNFGGTGGGLSLSLGQTSISGSTISGNFAQRGGGISVATATLTLTNSTVAENRALHEIGDVDAGPQSSVLIEASTFVASQGRAIAVRGTLRYRNSIFNAPEGAATFLIDVGGSTLSLGHNLFSQLEPSAGGTDLVKADPRLGPLAQNGGATRTYALLADSDALNTGHCEDSAGKANPTDQRGLARPEEGCDIGAFEVADEHGAVLDAVASLGTKLDTAVAPLATQQAVNQIGNTLAGIDFAGLATEASVDGVRAVVDQENVLLSARLDDRVSSRSSQASVDVWRAHEDRAAIERQLADGTRLFLFVLPRSLGGQIEDVRDVVTDVLARAEAARFGIGKAREQLGRANDRLASGQYGAAWDGYSAVYRALIGGR